MALPSRSPPFAGGRKTCKTSLMPNAPAPLCVIRVWQFHADP